MQLYDGQDRMTRAEFLRDWNVDHTTETTARAEELPWPPWIVFGRRVYYSRTLLTRWFEEHTHPAVTAQETSQLVEAARSP